MKSSLDSQGDTLDNWKAKIIDELKDSNITLKEGEIRRGDLGVIGKYRYFELIFLNFQRFLSVDDGFSKFKQSPWINEKYDCPYISDTLGKDVITFDFCRVFEL